MLLFLGIAQIILVVLLVSLVLVQNQSTDNILSLNSNQSANFAMRTPANFLSKLTWVIIALFLFNTVFLTIKLQTKQESKIMQELIKENTQVTAPFDD